MDDQIDRVHHTRRGKPAFWVEYSPEECILFSRFMVATAIANLSSFDCDHGGGGRAQGYALEALID